MNQLKLRITRLVESLKELESTALHRILENASWMMGEQILKIFGSLFVGILIARHLGVYQFGKLGFAMAYAGIFAIIGTLGLNRIGVRELVTARTEGRDPTVILDTLLFLRMGVSCLLALVVVGSAWLLHQGDLLLIMIVAPMVIFSSLDVIELWFQSQTLAKRTSSARSLSYLVIVTFRIALLFMGAGVEWFAFAYLLEFICASIALFWTYNRSNGQFSLKRFDKMIATRLLGESWPEIIAGFAGLLFMRMDQVMLGNLLGNRAVGIFAVASRLSESWYFVPLAISGSTFPSIIRIRTVDPDLYIRRIGQLMRLMVAVSYCAIAATTVLGPKLILTFYGPVFRESATVLTIQIWCGLFMALGIASGSWIMAERLVKLNLYRNLFGAAVNIALNFLLIPRYGPVGASVATLTSFICAYMLFDMLVPAMHQISRAKWRALLLLP